jgi:hypothetical protein
MNYPCHFSKRIFIIHNVDGGGTLKYINDLLFFKTEFILIRNKEELLSQEFHAYDIILVQQLFTDITPTDLLTLKEETSVNLIICIHDFFWFHVTSTIDLVQCAAAYLTVPVIHKDTLALFDKAILVIHPSKFTKTHYDAYFPTHNTIIQRHNDININYYCRNIPAVTTSINIGVIHEVNEFKGSENIELLRKLKNYKGYPIHIVVCNYTETNWHEVIQNLHGLLFLNKWGEPYCYALSKAIHSGLPILYNNIGSFKERIPLREHYVKVIEKEEDYHDEVKLQACFKTWIDYILVNQNTQSFPIHMDYKDLYYFLLTDRYVPSIYKKIHTHLQPFAVYFPQFHAIKENDINYYKGMTDVTNLFHYNKHKTLNEPLSMSSYDLTNNSLIKSQIQLAKSYGIYGFSMYYYWFSLNDITQKHTVMEKCHDLFFQNSVDYNIFFIWANEDWTSNPAFNTTHKIVNKYCTKSFNENSNHLIKYFKHKNYYKIDNKPVFYIHHPWCMSKSQLYSFSKILNHACILNGFNGVHLKINNMNGDVGYDFHPNYKKNRTIDYTDYVTNLTSTDCMFFNFNNTPRFHFSKFKPCTIFTNVTENACSEIIQKTKKEGIVLINSWNEWGEQMAVEPGTLTKNTLLLMIKHKLFPSLLSI